MNVCQGGISSETLPKRFFLYLALSYLLAICISQKLKNLIRIQRDAVGQIAVILVRTPAMDVSTLARELVRMPVRDVNTLARDVVRMPVRDVKTLAQELVRIRATDLAADNSSLIGISLLRAIITSLNTDCCV